METRRLSRIVPCGCTKDVELFEDKWRVRGRLPVLAAGVAEVIGAASEVPISVTPVKMREALVMSRPSEPKR